MLKTADAASAVRAVTVFRKRPAMLAFWALFGGAVSLQGLATAGYFIFIDMPQPQGLAIIVIGIAIALVLFGLVFLAYAVGRLRGPPDAIMIGPDGLHDRAVSGQPIPWRDITDVAVVRVRGLCLVFGVSAGAEMRAGIYLRQHLAAVFEKALGYPGYHVHIMGTEAEVESVAQAIAPFATVRGRD